MFGKRELAHLVIAVLVLGFIFGYDDGSHVFALSNWLINFLSLCFIVFVSLFLRLLVMKLFALRYRTKVEFEIWNINRFWLSKSSKIKNSFVNWVRKDLIKKFPIGIAVGFYFTFLSFGKIFFTGVFSHNLTADENARIGRSWKKLTEYEESLIFIFGFLATLFLAVIGKALMFDKLYMVNFWIFFFHYAPIPGLDGCKLFFARKSFYILFLIFAILFFILIKLGLIFGIIASGFLGLVLFAMYWWRFE